MEFKISVCGEVDADSDAGRSGILPDKEWSGNELGVGIKDDYMWLIQ